MNCYTISYIKYIYLNFAKKQLITFNNKWSQNKKNVHKMTNFDKKLQIYMIQ